MLLLENERTRQRWKATAQHTVRQARMKTDGRVFGRDEFGGRGKETHRRGEGREGLSGRIYRRMSHGVNIGGTCMWYFQQLSTISLLKFQIMVSF